MSPPTTARIAAEIRSARDTLATMVSEGEFDDLDFDVEHDMAALVEKLDTWATALELVGVQS